MQKRSMTRAFGRCLGVRGFMGQAQCSKGLGMRLGFWVEVLGSRMVWALGFTVRELNLKG